MSSRQTAEDLIARYLRPLVEADGGTIELLEVTSNKVVIRMSGACAGCPGRPYTVAHFIEPALRRALGHDVSVEMSAPR